MNRKQKVAPYLNRHRRQRGYFPLLVVQRAYFLAPRSKPRNNGVVLFIYIKNKSFYHYNVMELFNTYI